MATLRPGARRTGVVGVHDGRLKVAVTQVAEKGKANQAVLETVARALGLRPSQVKLASGETSPLKTLLLRNADLSVVDAALKRCVEAAS